MQIEITAVNTSRDEVWRAGFLFRPKKELTVKVTETGYAEIKACQALNIFEPGVRCPHPGCNFMAKNQGGLRFHKKIHDKERAEEGAKNG